MVLQQIVILFFLSCLCCLSGQTGASTPSYAHSSSSSIASSSSSKSRNNLRSDFSLHPTVHAVKAARRALAGNGGAPPSFDIIMTWVNCNDMKWRNKFESFGFKFVAERFVPSNEAQLSLTSMSKYAPWVRKIYIVTDDQQFNLSFLPDLEFRNRVHFVDHKDIIPNEYLPVFNSHVIEGYLHNIKGLAEYFIYFNDDMMIGRPISPYDFFTSTGKLTIPLIQSLSVRVNCLWLEAMPPEETSHGQVVRNTQLLFKRHYKKCQPWVNKMHYPYVNKKSFMEKMSKVFKNDLKRISKNRVRSTKFIDRSGDFMPMLLAQYVGVESGDAEFNDEEFSISFVNGRKPTTIMALCTDSYHFITVQDMFELSDQDFTSSCTCLIKKMCAADDYNVGPCLDKLVNTSLCIRPTQ